MDNDEHNQNLSFHPEYLWGKLKSQCIRPDGILVRTYVYEDGTKVYIYFPLDPSYKEIFNTLHEETLGPLDLDLDY